METKLTQEQLRQVFETNESVIGFKEDHDQVYPIVAAYTDESKHLCFWCNYCDEWHYHGINEGHRLAHCFSERSPFLQNGVVLHNSGEYTKEIKAKYRAVAKKYKATKKAKLKAKLDEMKRADSRRKQKKEIGFIYYKLDKIYPKAIAKASSAVDTKT